MKVNHNPVLRQQQVTLSLYDVTCNIANLLHRNA
jgi:hypothetical protein